MLWRTLHAEDVTAEHHAFVKELWRRWIAQTVSTIYLAAAISVQRYPALHPCPCASLSRPFTSEHLPIFRPHKIRHSLRLSLVVVRTVRIIMDIMRTMPMPVRIVAFLRANILHLIHASALRATLDWAVAGAS